MVLLGRTVKNLAQRGDTLIGELNAFTFRGIMCLFIFCAILAKFGCVTLKINVLCCSEP